MTIFFPGLAHTQYGALETSDELDTPILISLFSWAPAQDGDTPRAGEKFGWWADFFSDVEGDVFGSRLWTQKNQPVKKALLAIPSLAEEALQWMVEDKLVKSIKCEASLDIHDHITITVLAERFPVNGKSLSRFQRTYTFPLV